MSDSAPHDPPFRAEHIGSLLRPPGLLAARADHAAGKIDDAALRAKEDEAIRQAVGFQAEIGLSSVTDGEFRRGAYSDSFTIDGFEGVSIGYTQDSNWTYSDSKGRISDGRVPTVHGRLRWTGPVNVENFSYLSSVAGNAVAKMTLPGPAYIHFRAGRDNISRDVYPDLDGFWQDLVDAYHKEIAALAAAGCRYIQLDETSIAKLGDPRIRDGLARRGDDWETLLDVYTDVINEVVRGAPDGVSFGLHLCRGNKAGSWQAETGYDDVAAKLFRKLDIRFYFLEFDSPRAGTFEPLRELPSDKTAVLGLVSTKTAVLETADYLKRRIEAAAEYVGMVQLAISPQCGFASSEVGNDLSYEDQVAKLRLVVEVATDMWGYQPPHAS